jgi:hypothetical protein
MGIKWVKTQSNTTQHLFILNKIRRKLNMNMVMINQINKEKLISILKTKK